MIEGQNLNGYKVKFLRDDGKICEDTIRGEVFKREILLEPYGRNAWVLAVVLTEHSWIRVSSIIQMWKI